MLCWLLNNAGHTEASRSLAASCFVMFSNVLLLWPPQSLLFSVVTVVFFALGLESRVNKSTNGFPFPTTVTNYVIPYVASVFVFANLSFLVLGGQWDTQ